MLIARRILSIRVRSHVVIVHKVCLIVLVVVADVVFDTCAL